MDVRKAIATDEERICIVDMAHQRRIEGVEWFHQELVKFMTACNQGRSRERFLF